MAKKKAKANTNKSQAIRDYKAAHPEAGPKAIAEHLNKNGHSVTAQFVSTVLTVAKKRAGKPVRKRGRPVGSGTSKPSAKKAPALTDAFDQLMAAKLLVEKLGSVEAAKAAVDAYSKLAK